MASARTVGKVGIVGLGTMGAGIAQVCIQAGVPTVAWGVLWIGVALALSFWLVRRAYRDA